MAGHYNPEVLTCDWVKMGGRSDAAGTVLRVSKMDDFQPAPFTILGWQVPRIESAVRKLTSQGVSFNRYDFLPQDELGIWLSPSGARVAWFKDPEGNVLSLTQFPGKASVAGGSKNRKSEAKRRKR
jgi:hypothetical protein